MLDFSFWSVLTLVRLLLLTTGMCALAVWATRLRDAQSELVEKFRLHAGASCAETAELLIVQPIPRRSGCLARLLDNRGWRRVCATERAALRELSLLHGVEFAVQLRLPLGFALSSSV